MTEFIIIGSGNLSTGLKIMMALRNIADVIIIAPDSIKTNEEVENILDTIVVPPDSASKIYEGSVLELEPEFLFKKIYSDIGSRITVQDLRNHSELFKRAISREIVEPRIIPQKIPIPAQCKRAAKIQKVWKTQQ